MGVGQQLHMSQLFLGKKNNLLLNLAKKERRHPYMAHDSLNLVVMG